MVKSSIGALEPELPEEVGDLRYLEADAKVGLQRQLKAKVNRRRRPRRGTTRSASSVRISPDTQH
jgi:hypothetical protein